MSTTCCSCRRPVPLSPEEVAVLGLAARSWVRVADLPKPQADCVRTLIRMGYLVKVANDDGPRGRAVRLTEHGHRRLTEA